jgi:hypothetical protein
MGIKLLYILLAYIIMNFSVYHYIRVIICHKYNSYIVCYNIFIAFI